MDGVLFTSLGDTGNGNGAQAYMADGRVLTGADALKIIEATNAYNEANPVKGVPAQIIRGMERSTAVPELGYMEMNPADYEAFAANGGIGRLTEAMAQGAVDEQAPAAAKERGALAERRLANEGGVAQAQASAGPAYARVALDRQQFNQERDDAIKGIGTKSNVNRYTVVPGGQEVVDIGGLPTTITRPSRVLNNQSGQYIDADNMPAVGNYKVGQIYTDASGNKAKWDGRQFVAVK
jgi:hypothetical protein